MLSVNSKVAPPSRETASVFKQELVDLRTSLQESSRESRSFEQSLHEIFEIVGGTALYLDDRLDVRFATPSAKRIFNLESAGAESSELKASLLEVDDRLMEDAKKALSSSTRVERSVRDPEGKVYRRRVIPFGGMESGAGGLVVLYSTREMKSRSAEEADALKQQLRLASAEKSRIFASASHDLRQPLQSMVLLHALLARTVAEEKAQKLVARLDDILNSMTTTINALLEINQIEDLHLEPTVTAFPVNDVLQRIEREFLPQAQSAGLKLRIVPCALPIESDPVLLTQILRSLLSNALAYTSQGKILLGCRRRAHTLTIEIWDTGIGIPAEEIDEIFEEFHQLGRASGKVLGVGLGLPIVRRLAHLLGHKVGLHSQLGRGTVFTLEIAANYAEMSKQGHGNATSSRTDSPPPGAVATRTRRANETLSPVIFVVDDDRRVREALRSVLEDDGHIVEDFESCQDFLRDYLPGRESCLLIDAYLPGMNGLELLRKLRSEGDCPAAIMITGNADVSTAVQAMKAGALDFIEKPIGRTELLTCVAQALGHARDSTALTAKREAAATQLSELTPRQRQIMDLVLAGQPSKNIAADLGISQRTVENHRASIMKRTGSRSLPELARLALTASFKDSKVASG
jgi:two-component system CheB/CheR fusion protein